MSDDGSNNGGGRNVPVVAFYVGFIVVGAIYPIFLFFWCRFLRRRREDRTTNSAAAARVGIESDNSASGKENVGRKNLVMDSLITKKVLSHLQISDLSASDKNQSLTTDISQDHHSDPTIIVDENAQTNPSSKDEMGDEKIDAAEMACDNYTLCMICLEPYRVGEFVSWSRSTLCGHVFHEDCVVQWLMKNDECPCCRTNWLNCRGTSISSCNPGLDGLRDITDLQFCETHGLVISGCENGFAPSTLLGYTYNTMKSTKTTSLANIDTRTNQTVAASNFDCETTEETNPSQLTLDECAQ